MDRRFRLPERLISYNLKAPESKRKYNRKVFAAVSGRYAVARRALSFGLDPGWKRRLLSWLPETGSFEILDLACGTGEITGALAKRFPEGRIVGIDLSPEMIGRAKRRFKTGNPHFRLGDMDSLPFGNEVFDIVTGGYALRNAPDLDRALGEIHRVMKPGGSAAFLEFSAFTHRRMRTLQIRLLRLWGSLWGVLLHGNPEVYGYIAESLSLFPDKSSLDEAFRSHGFQVVRSRPLFFSFVRLTLCRRR